MRRLANNFYRIVMATLAMTSFGAARGEAEQYFVKVKSMPCRGDDEAASMARMGSGAIVKDSRGQALIVTSSHVVYHGGEADGVCAFVKLQGLPWQKSQLMHVNSGLGVAALAVPAEYAAREGLNLDAQPLKGADAVALGGFPLASDNVIIDSGRVLAVGSKRIHLPLLTEAIEIEGAHSEYGMSGGAVVRPLSATYAGLISHQYLRIEAGKKARVESGESPNDGHAMVGLVIPAAIIKAWIEHFDDVREDLSPQWQGLTSVTFGSLRFSEKTCDAVSLGSGIGGQGVGVGGQIDGGQGVGVGGQIDGGQGVGVGGSIPVLAICGVQVEKVSGDQVAATQAWPFASSGTWFSKLAGRQGAKPISFLEMVEPKTLDRQSVRNLYQALTLLANGYRPNFVGIKGDWGASAEGHIKAARAAYDSLKKSAVLEQAPGATKKLFSDLDILLTAVETGNTSILDAKISRQMMVSDASGLFQEVWVYLFNLDFSTTVDLQVAVVKLLDFVDARRD
jgi:hypothetical protein